MGKRQAVATPGSILPANHDLAAYCPDLDQWASSWRGEDRDLLPGQQIVECFKPFLRHLLSCPGRSFRHPSPIQAARRVRRKAPLESGVFATPFRRPPAVAERDSRRQYKAWLTSSPKSRIILVLMLLWLVAVDH